MRAIVPLAAAAALLGAAPATAGTEFYVFTGRITTIDANPALLTLKVAQTNNAAKRFRFAKVHFHIALADVETLDRTGDGVGLPEDVQAGDRVRITAKLNRRSRQPFEATRLVNLSAPPG